MLEKGAVSLSDEENGIGSRRAEDGSNGVSEEILNHGSRQNAHISWSDFKLEVDKDDVLSAARDYKSWTCGYTTFEDLPRFDDCTQYNIGPQQEEDLMSAETDKIKAFAAAQEPPLFDGAKCFGIADNAGFNHLSFVASQIYCNFAILVHDNVCVALRNYPRTHFFEILMEMRQVIRERYGETSQSKLRDKLKLLVDDERNREAYHKLVDYTIGCTAWWLLRVAINRSRTTQIISILARWAKKLKIIALEPAWWTEHALADSFDLMREMSEAGKEDDKILISLPDNTKDGQHQSIDFLRAERNLASPYYDEKMQIRQSLAAIFRNVVESLMSFEHHTNGASMFEISTMIYSSGLDQTLTLLSSGRRGNIWGSSRPLAISNSYIAMRLVLANAEKLRRASKLAYGIAHEPSEDTVSRAEIRWRHAEVAKSSPLWKESLLQAAYLDEIISILVPLSLSNLRGSNNNTLMWYFEDEEDPMRFIEPPSTETRLEFKIVTNDYLEKRRLRAPVSHDADVVPLSRAPLSQGIRVGTDLHRLVNEDRLKSNTQSGIKERSARIIEQYRGYQSSFNSWIISERTVLVPCRGYSIACRTLALAVVAAALAVPFSVGERIPGVDPFQIVTFSWLLAGVILVFAKSRFVADWPWHDFFQGQVLCRNVKELAEVTGIPDQMILMYLLHNEETHILEFSGPYTGFFSKLSNDGNGFSINVSLDLSTALATGFILVKVTDMEGKPYIMVEDLRDKPCRGSSSRGTLACKDMERYSKWTHPLQQPSAHEMGQQVMKLKWEKDLSYKSAAGLYMQAGCKLG